MADTASGGGTTEREVEAWVRAELGLPPEAEVTIAEVACTRPGCSPVETAVTVTAPGEAPFVVTIGKSVPEVEAMDVLAALAWGGDAH